MIIGIIGGSGLENLSIFGATEEINIKTEFGYPASTLYKTHAADDKEVLILSRHGRDHSIPPTHVNNRANISALKQAGAEFIIATTACGSLREEIGTGDLVIPDQFIDFTRHRAVTFYDTFKNTGPVHTAMPDPFDEKLRNIIFRKATDLGYLIHKQATVITIEGPRFSTRAESRMYRSWGADIVNMSTAPEAALANEAGIPYAALAISTDYDSWREDSSHVTWEDILKVFNSSISEVKQALAQIILAM
ncbi:MAG: MTAP family purine nucleoside phosphorylase [Bacteroidales bacterium]|nr:MTAP family purine nucleoside phosphorylase [Bacteroidales bacterium]